MNDFRDPIADKESGERALAALVELNDPGRTKDTTMNSLIKGALSCHEAYERSLTLGCADCQRQYLLEETHRLLRALMLCYEKLNGLGLTETRDLNQLKNGSFPV